MVINLLSFIESGRVEKGFLQGLMYMFDCLVSLAERERERINPKEKKRGEVEAMMKKKSDVMMMKKKSDVTNDKECGGSCSSRKRKKMIDENVNQLHNKKRKLKIKTLSPRPAYEEGDVLDLCDLLFTKDRDFLVTYKDRDRPVQAKHLEA
ncbi:hypothetical protein POM88_005127 [Heracleum sosnowskyi]|uniref:Uncharacterized protein n=1 Tax=Heracleum sosnowskyi TaxID=360622 RepID=A0AAD8JN33_9APIA|nr:hypothetical protein POM88_005127 [Heracleum sosnowskyi]